MCLQKKSNNICILIGYVFFKPCFVLNSPAPVGPVGFAPCKPPKKRSLTPTAHTHTQTHQTHTQRIGGKHSGHYHNKLACF